MGYKLKEGELAKVFHRNGRMINQYLHRCSCSIAIVRQDGSKIYFRCGRGYNPYIETSKNFAKHYISGISRQDNFSL